MHVEAKVRGQWHPATLTIDVACSPGQAVVIVAGEILEAADVEALRCTHDTPAELVDAAVDAGFYVIGGPRKADRRPRRGGMEGDSTPVGPGGGD